MPTAERKSREKMVLTWGMGVESTAVLVRWLTDPRSRDFDLRDLIVLVSMVGNEFGSTIRDCETHVLPLLRTHGIRLVQAARAGRLQQDGIVVLDDSRRPRPGGNPRRRARFRARQVPTRIRGPVDQGRPAAGPVRCRRGGDARRGVARSGSGTVIAGFGKTV